MRKAADSPANSSRDSTLPVGLAGEAEQGADAVGIPMRGDMPRRQLIVTIRTGRYQLCTGFDQAQEMAVAGIAGVGEQPVASGVHQQAAGEQQRTGAAGRDQHALGVDLQAVALAVEGGDGLAQRRQSARRGIAGVAGRQRRLAGFDDRRCGGEVRFAYLQVDHVVALALERLGPRQQRHDMKRRNLLAAAAVAKLGVTGVGTCIHGPIIGHGLVALAVAAPAAQTRLHT